MIKKMDKKPEGRSRKESKQTRKEPGHGIELAKKPGKLTRQDVTCPICWSILFEPTTLPCKHSLCIKCFKQHVQETSICCPCCRRRLSIWSRGASKAQKLLDEPLWNRIQSEFPKLVAARYDGLDSQDILEGDLPPLFGEQAEGNETENGNVVRIIRDGIISNGQGELYAEMQKILEEHEKELANKRQLEEAASAELIRQIQLQDENERKQRVIDSSLEEEDFLFAKRLQNKLRREEQRLRISSMPSRSSTRVKRPVRRSLTFTGELTGSENSFGNRSYVLETPTDSSFSEENSSTYSTPQLTLKKRKKAPSCTVTSEEVQDPSAIVDVDTTGTGPTGESLEKVETFCEEIVEPAPAAPNQKFADLFNEIYNSLGFSNGQETEINPDSTSLQDEEFNPVDISAIYPLSAWIDEEESVNHEMTDVVSSSPVPPTPDKYFDSLSNDPMSIQLIWEDSNNVSLHEGSDEMIIGEAEYQFMLLEQEALQARRQRAEQEASDRAFARSLSTKIRLGLSSPKSQEDSYRLRRSRSRKEQTGISTAEGDDCN
ncbi:unnamed protein product [Orchesella dallaii]|uniref:RING-type E3 ubiquitin transferase n=1 Tax=Orchesella dallaii TaxID=48710 RepID=A0ABP1QY56_9HEXA